MDWSRALIQWMITCIYDSPRFNSLIEHDRSLHPPNNHFSLDIYQPFHSSYSCPHPKPKCIQHPPLPISTPPYPPYSSYSPILFTLPSLTILLFIQPFLFIIYFPLVLLFILPFLFIPPPHYRSFFCPSDFSSSVFCSLLTPPPFPSTLVFSEPSLPSTNPPPSQSPLFLLSTIHPP